MRNRRDRGLAMGGCGGDDDNDRAEVVQEVVKDCTTSFANSL